MLDRNPFAGPKVSGKDTDQPFPGTDANLKPGADRREENYTDSGRLQGLAPGPVWTPLIPATLEPEHVKKFGQDTLWKRPAQPVEIAAGFVYLASAHARYVSGKVMAITGKTSSR